MSSFKYNTHTPVESIFICFGLGLLPVLGALAALVLARTQSSKFFKWSMGLTTGIWLLFGLWKVLKLALFAMLTASDPGVRFAEHQSPEKRMRIAGVLISSVFLLAMLCLWGLDKFVLSRRAATTKDSEEAQAIQKAQSIPPALPALVYLFTLALMIYFLFFSMGIFAQVVRDVKSLPRTGVWIGHFVELMCIGFGFGVVVSYTTQSKKFLSLGLSMTPVVAFLIGALIAWGSSKVIDRTVIPSFGFQSKFYSAVGIFTAANAGVFVYLALGYILPLAVALNGTIPKAMIFVIGGMILITLSELFSIMG
jgi:hypothetical protein